MYSVTAAIGLGCNMQYDVFSSINLGGEVEIRESYHVFHIFFVRTRTS